ncbi:Heavy metal transport/detoxification superfamily protein [Striga hermonthica]|uniref:Heavy metal transport/detoxification superfamily protein n=1 Tax=Striga hermonthica TaxID=68872 RepID=A0A9N7R8L9_STRHE|nr:Heavy metal transport/detoxification superfamily protein [Striga hermonthica]
MTIVEMRVHMDCPGCETKIMKALSKLDGVDTIDIDMYMQKVTVTGVAHHDKVLKTVRKTGRLAELWTSPYNPEYHDYCSRYNYYGSSDYNYMNSHPNGFMSEPCSYGYYMAEPSRSSWYNYYKHGYNRHDHGYYQRPPSLAILGEEAATYFSDDNANGCWIM